MGSVITVTNGAGVSVTCKVVSRGPFVTGRVVDLARSTFAALGPVSKGLVTVTVSW
jgi:rare lipoprotein A